METVWCGILLHVCLMDGGRDGWMDGVIDGDLQSSFFYNVYKSLYVIKNL